MLFPFDGMTTRPTAASRPIRAEMVRCVLCAFAAVSSGALLAMAFPRYDCGWVVWIALGPLLIAILGRSSKWGLSLSGVCGLVFFPIMGNWLFEVRSYTLQHHAVWSLYLASYFAVFGMIASFISRRRGFIPALVATPFLWVAFEYLRSNMSFMAFPWGLLAHSQYRNPSIMQIASLTGAYGLSFLIAAVNSAAAGGVLFLVFAPGNKDVSLFRRLSGRGVLIFAGAVAVLLAACYQYGRSVIPDRHSGKEIKVSLVQGNIEQSKKWDPKWAGFIMETYSTLSDQASRQNPSLIVWPEAATPGLVLKRMDLHRQMVSIIRRAHTHFLIGSAEYPKFSTTPVGPGQTGNTALFFAPEGKVLGQYLKVSLLPFAEYIPYEGIIPWPEFLAPKDRKLSEIAGKEYTLFELEKTEFGVTICWENIFADVVREFVKGGARFIVNLTNEAWFGKSAAPHQFLSMNVFRAVENRVFVLRCANTGISCFIDPCGRIVNQLQDETGETLFVRGVLTGTVVAAESNTIYTTYGDWFAVLTLICSAVFLVVSLFKKGPDTFSS